MTVEQIGGWKTKERGHIQRPFTTFKGEQTYVDEGLLPVLSALRWFGVETLFSCEEGRGQAYVLAERAGFSELVRTIRKLHRKGYYSPEADEVVKGFLSGTRKLDVWYRQSDKNKNLKRLVYDWGGRNPYSYEILFSNKYGARICIRWPEEKTPVVHRLLSETMLKF